MGMSPSERHQIENEMIFRRANEKVGDDLDEVDAALIEQGLPELIQTPDLKLHFKCECSDENCEERIQLSLDTYKQIHNNRKSFILKPNHQVDSIETVIKTKRNYIVVQKNHTVADPGETLNETTVDNR